MLRAFESFVNRLITSRKRPSGTVPEDRFHEMSSPPAESTSVEAESFLESTEFTQTSYRKHEKKTRTNSQAKKRESGDLSLAYLLVQQSHGHYTLEVASRLPNSTLLALLERYSPTDVTEMKAYLEEAQEYDDQFQNHHSKVPSNYGLR